MLVQPVLQIKQLPPIMEKQSNETAPVIGQAQQQQLLRYIEKQQKKAQIHETFTEAGAWEAKYRLVERKAMSVSRGQQQQQLVLVQCRTCGRQLMAKIQEAPQPSTILQGLQHTKLCKPHSQADLQKIQQRQARKRDKKMQRKIQQREEVPACDLATTTQQVQRKQNDQESAIAGNSREGGAQAVNQEVQTTITHSNEVEEEKSTSAAIDANQGKVMELNQVPPVRTIPKQMQPLQELNEWHDGYGRRRQFIQQQMMANSNNIKTITTRAGSVASSSALIDEDYLDMVLEKVERGFHGTCTKVLSSKGTYSYILEFQINGILAAQATFRPEQVNLLLQYQDKKAIAPQQQSFLLAVKAPKHTYALLNNDFVRVSTIYRDSPSDLAQHVIPYLGHVDIPPQNCAFAMPLMRCTLKELVTDTAIRVLLKGAAMERNCTPGELKARIILQITKGLLAGHLAGFSHRDLKPDNILIDQSLCCAFISDWGLSELVTSRQKAHGAPELATTSKDLFASLADGSKFQCQEEKKKKKMMLNPEKCFAELTLEDEQRADAWSLGLLIYFLYHSRWPLSSTVLAELNANWQKNIVCDQGTLQRTLEKQTEKQTAFLARLQKKLHDILDAKKDKTEVIPERMQRLQDQLLQVDPLKRAAISYDLIHTYWPRAEQISSTTKAN